MVNMRWKSGAAAAVTKRMIVMKVMMVCTVLSVLMGVSASPITRTILAEQHGRDLLANGLGVTPPMGWNSWNHFQCKIDENMIKETADALISTGLSKLGYTYVNIDDCWAEVARDDKGTLVPKKSTFPAGIKALADYVHSKGLKLGIYSDAGHYGLPFMQNVCAETDLLALLPLHAS